MTKSKVIVDTWLRTDTDQFVKKINKYVWLVYNEGTEHRIDIRGFTKDELEEEVSGYYANLAEVKKLYGKDWIQIMVEIIAENS